MQRLEMKALAKPITFVLAVQHANATWGAGQEGRLQTFCPKSWERGK